MSILQFVWIGDLDSRNQVSSMHLQNPDALNHERCHPKKMIIKADRIETRIGRKNSKMPPDYALESAVSNRMISRNHVTIERLSKGNYMLYDHSLNGTYVNFVRVIGGTILKHEDVVCFGHINGANIKPGENVTPFYTDLKYRVEIIEKNNKKSENYSQSDSSFESEQPKLKSPTKDKHSMKNKYRKSSQLSELSDQSSNESGAMKSVRKRKKHPPNQSEYSSSEEEMPYKSKYIKSDKNSTLSHYDDSFDMKRSNNNINNKPVNPSDKPGQRRKSDLMKRSGDKSIGGASKEKNNSQIRSNVLNTRTNQSSSKSKFSMDKGGSKRTGNNNVNSSYEYEECSAKHCSRPDGDVVIDWIMCDKCSQWYHQYCVGLDEPLEDDENYYCPDCI